MGVVKVIRPDTGFAQIPNRFAEDYRLSEDAVAVGLYLASRWDGYRISPEQIRFEFSKRPGKTRGRDWWKRVSGELNLAGYMRLSRTHGEGGRFVSNWIFCISGIADCEDRQRSAAADSADRGEPASGSPAGGTASTYTQEGFSQEGFTQQRTTTTHVATRRGSGKSAMSRIAGPDLLFDRYVLHHRELLTEMLHEIPIDTAQAIVDELAGAERKASMGQRSKVVSIRGWVSKMIELAARGKFVPDLGKLVHENRELGRAIRETGDFQPPALPRMTQVGEQHLSGLRSITKRGKFGPLKGMG